MDVFEMRTGEVLQYDSDQWQHWPRHTLEKVSSSVPATQMWLSSQLVFF